MPDRPVIIPLYETPRRRWWIVVQVVLTFVVAIAVVRSLQNRQPSVGFIRSAPTVTTAATTGNVTNELFLVLRSQDVGTEVFSCPATQPTSWEFDTGDVGTTHRASTNP